MSGGPISFRILGTPQAWKRPERNWKTGAIYTAEQDRVWRESVWGQAMAYRPEKPWEGPVELSLTFIFPVPESWPKWRKKLACGRPAQNRKDLSNLLKAIEDALTGLFWHDDRQIAMLDVSKWYPEPEQEAPSVQVGIIFHDPLPERRPKGK